MILQSYYCRNTARSGSLQRLGWPLCRFPRCVLQTGCRGHRAPMVFPPACRTPVHANLGPEVIQQHRGSCEHTEFEHHGPDSPGSMAGGGDLPRHLASRIRGNPEGRSAGAVGRLLPAHPVGRRRRGPVLPWTLRNSSGVSKGIDKSVVQSGRDFPYIRVGGGQ